MQPYRFLPSAAAATAAATPTTFSHPNTSCPLKRTPSPWLFPMPGTASPNMSAMHPFAKPTSRHPHGSERIQSHNLSLLPWLPIQLPFLCWCSLSNLKTANSSGYEPVLCYILRVPGTLMTLYNYIVIKTISTVQTICRVSKREGDFPHRVGTGLFQVVL